MRPTCRRVKVPGVLVGRSRDETNDAIERGGGGSIHRRAAIRRWRPGERRPVAAAASDGDRVPACERHSARRVRGCPRAHRRSRRARRRCRAAGGARLFRNIAAAGGERRAALRRQARQVGLAFQDRHNQVRVVSPWKARRPPTFRRGRIQTTRRPCVCPRPGRALVPGSLHGRPEDDAGLGVVRR